MANTIVWELESLWNAVDASVWTAPRKKRYEQRIYRRLCDKANEIEQNIQELERHSQNCVSQCNIV